ncbi:MAG TPA: hypothetical protein VEB43_18370 [Anaeromyxobacter sp.]|nr:hypothetical protein [Anaeromyxobacter sp.]
MGRGTWVVIGAAAALGLGAALWLGRSEEPPTEEQRIRALLEGAAKAAAERKADEVIEILSARFEGGGGGELGGRASRDDVKRLVAFELLRGRWVSVELLDPPRIEVREGRARAVVDAVLSRSAGARGRLSDLLPGEYSLHRFALELAIEDEEWRVVRGTWRPIGLDEALSGPAAPDW